MLIFSLEMENSINLIVSNDYSLISDSSIIICSAGKWISNEDLKNPKYKDNSGRLIQTLSNKNMILNIAENINNYSKNSLFVIATNQVDLLYLLFRKKFTLLNVICIDGYVDNIRLKQVIYDNFGIRIKNGFIIYYHNNDMFPLISSVVKSDNSLFFKKIFNKKNN